jgi:hypothetical protein
MAPEPLRRAGSRAARRLALLAALFALSPLRGAPLAAQSLDELLDRHFAAIGGRERIRAVRTLKLAGRQVGGGQEVPLTIYWQRPDRIRAEFALRGVTGIQAFDGDEAWMVMPMAGREQPGPMSEDERKDIVDQADLLEGPLFDWQEKGHRVELLGPARVGEAEAWRIRVDKRNGDRMLVYLDAATMLDVRHESTRVRGGRELETESTLGDYREVGGLRIAHAVESRRKGMPQVISFVVDEAQVDLRIDPAIFERPRARDGAPPPAAGPDAR